MQHDARRDDARDLTFWTDAPDDTPAGRYVGPERREADRCKWCGRPRAAGHRIGCHLRSASLSPADVRLEDVDPRDDLPP